MLLFHTPGSPYARMARIAVLEHGLAARVGVEETTLRDPASPLLARNPVGRVPTLVLDDGTVLTETILILQALDSIADGPPLLPMQGWGVAAALGQVIGMLDGIAVWNRELRRPGHERSPGVIALETTRAGRAADALDRAVAGGAHGGPLDAAQVALACALGYCDRRHRAWDWREGRPALAAWLDGFARRPAFQATLPPPSGL